MPFHDGFEPSGVKLSPWRRLRAKKSQSADHPDNKKSKKGIFSTPIRKLSPKKRSKKKKEKKADVDELVTVKVLPKSPMRNENDNSNAQIIRIVQSPPRILRPNVRSLETEETFNEMFQSYMMKYHNHEQIDVDIPVYEEEFILCEEASQCSISIPTHVGPPSAEDTSVTGTSEEDTIYFDQNGSVVSALTIPLEIRPSVHQSPGEVLRRFSKRASEVADAFLSCGEYTLPSPREEDEFEDESEAEADDEVSESEYEYSTSSSEVDLEFIIPEITLRNCGY